MDVWETAFCAGVVDVVSRDRGGLVSLDNSGSRIGYDNEIRLKSNIVRGKGIFILYYIFQRPDIGILKLTEVSLNVVIEINLPVWSVKSYAINVYGFQCTFTTVNSDSLGYPLVVP